MVSINRVRLRQVIGRCPPELEQPPFSSSEATSASNLHLNASFFSMFRRNRCSLQPSPPLLVHQTLVAAPESSVQPSPVACSPSAFATSRVQDIFTMGGLPIESSSCAIALPKPPEDKSPGTSVGPDSKPKKKICCACPETKKLRDECIVEHGEFACKKWIEAHLKCLRTEGFNV
nr:cytochrome C oxidase copper chaperone 1-like [Ipomoea batatas]